MKPELILLHKSGEETDLLKNECEIYTRYLVDHMPNAYVHMKYAEAHRAKGFAPTLEGTGFDGVLLQISRFHPLAARLVDTYSSAFRKNAVVRKKMILLLAILETCAPTYSDFDLGQSQGMIRLGLGVVQQSTALLLSLLLGTLLFLPLQAGFSLASFIFGRSR